ncbi:hypothetical protein K505DRAFT_115483 [Melanomma pulvis-pyrius CBS 109.77]|uniref:Uncharacterized protein n=1 Tax=Melanomma pulvis-pyrius CBS 109.77 TaxID=1314802 RepID=A0A6A6WWS6_9PLEO|nr:hypothetical protein K505DRAFT_115483 [Melanomma pulvis-pyrius CBS 109.77]
MQARPASTSPRRPKTLHDRERASLPWQTECPLSSLWSHCSRNTPLCTTSEISTLAMRKISPLPSPDCLLLVAGAHSGTLEDA